MNRLIGRLGAAFFMLGLLAQPAHAQENRAALAATINHQLPTNSQGLITAAILRNVLNTLVNSITAITGDVNVIANTVLAQVPPDTVKANVTGSPANVADVSMTTFFNDAPTGSIPVAALAGGINPTGFQPTSTYATLAVTGSSARVALPSALTNPDVIIYNTGTVAAYVQLGSSSVVATTGNDVVQPGSWISFVVGTNTNIAAITSTGSTNLNISGGNGLATGSGGGSTSSGGSGLSVTDEAAFTAGTSSFTPTGGTYNTSIPSLTSGQQGTAALSANRSLHTTEDNSAAILSAVSNPIPAGTNTIGNLASQYPGGAVPLTATAVGTTLATTATLTGTSAKTTYICGFDIRANATGAATGTATVTGVITGTLDYLQWTAPLASGIGLVTERFTPCVPASATNTGIAVISAAPGSGGNVTVTATGYQL